MSPRFLALVGWSALVALAGCTVEGEDMMTTFFDPANPSGNPPTGSSAGTGDGTDSTSTPPDTGDSTSEATTNETNETNETSDTSAESSGGGADEQPANGMYSECASGVDCIGLTTCVLVPGSAGGGYCSNTGCANAVVDCDANPGAASSAAVECVDNGAGALVCALSCAGGLTCPGGMDCLPLGVTMVCA